MREHIRHQVIEKDGEPAFVVIPYEDYIRFISSKDDLIPPEVAKRYLTDEVSMIKAWREYLNFTQKEVAGKMGITQAAYAQMEKPGARLKKDTLDKIASALGIAVSQLEAE